MPGLIRGATAIGTLPYSLSTKFSESHATLLNSNEYHDGSCQRVSLVTSGRRTWKISKRLDAFHLGLLRDFYEAAHGGAFYFYNPSETLPPYSRSPTGTSGRYLVRFNSDWTQTNGMARIDTELELIEVAGAQDIADASPVTNAAVPNSATLFLKSSYTSNGTVLPLVGAGASLEGASTFFPFPDWFSSTSGWATRTDAKSINPNSLTDGSLFVLLSMANDSFATASFTPADELRIYYCYAVLTYGDGSTFTWRPTAHSGALITNGSVGSIVGLDNAIDNDPDTFALMSCTKYGGTGLAGVFFSLSGFAEV